MAGLAAIALFILPAPPPSTDVSTPGVAVTQALLSTPTAIPTTHTPTLQPTIIPTPDSPPQSSNNVGLLFDGIYKADEGEFSYYLRFYDDGTVIEVGQPHATNPDSLTYWFRKGVPTLASGKYEVVGDQVNFSTSNSSGTVDFQGSIGLQNLVLDVHSRINNSKRKLEFRFVNQP